VSSVIRHASEVTASLPFCVYRGEPKIRAENSWQWSLLHSEPDEMGTGVYQFFYDIEISLEATSNAFIQKAKSPNRIEALYVLDPQRVRVYADPDTMEKRFDVYISPTKQNKGLTTDDILHIRGFAVNPGGLAGTPLLQVHRDSLGNALALQGFEGDFFRNNAQTPFFFTGAQNKSHAMELIDMHNQEHQGVGRQFKVGALWGQADVKPMPISMVDAQFVEAMKITLEDACRVFRWPKEFLETATEQRPIPDEDGWQNRVLKFYVLPRLKRIESAFNADADLLANSGMVGEFLTNAFERVAFTTRMVGYKDARQGGWITANEIREKENFPPRPDGDSLLITPTGSAPNAPTPVKPLSPLAPDAPSQNGQGTYEEVFT
jgi:HK97 family phage portal protein